jgi:short-subunit dehydrogenase
VIVITGASSGIGLTTARMAAEAGAKLVLTARDERVLRDVVEGIRAEGGQAVYLAGDVTEPLVSQNVARLAEHAYGRIDTWINNAGVGVSGSAEQVPVEDMRRLFDVNFWGTVYGTQAALPRLKRQGGVLINMGSIECDIGVPLHSAYSASKHAVKGFTDSLRMELEKEEAPVVVTLVKPAAIDTPFFEHSRNYLDKNYAPPPPVYAPEVVARTLLTCAVRPVREITVGGSGRAMIGLMRQFPHAGDRLFEATMYEAQTTDRPRRGPREGSLRRPGVLNGSERGPYDGMVRERSYSTGLALTPGRTLLGLALFGAGLFAARRLMRSSEQGRAGISRRTLGLTQGPSIREGADVIVYPETLPDPALESLWIGDPGVHAE